MKSTKTLQWSPLQPIVDSTAAIGGVHCGHQWSPLQRSVESTAVFSGIQCEIRMFKVFDSGIHSFAAKFAAEKLPKEWNRLQRNSIC